MHTSELLQLHVLKNAISFRILKISSLLLPKYLEMIILGYSRIFKTLLMLILNFSVSYVNLKYSLTIKKEDSLTVKKNDCLRI